MVEIGELPPLPPRTEQAPPPAGEPRPIRELRLALVGEVRGEVEPCGCPTLPYGGFVRRQRLLDELRAAPTPLFHLDAGDTLLKGFSSERRDRDERAAAILTLSEAVGVDVWVPGPSDLLAIGLDAIRDAPVPAVSATWARPDGTLALPPSIVLERDGVRIGVIGLSAPPSDPGLRAQLSLVDPVDAARTAAAALPADLDLVIGLGSLSDQEAARVAREVPALAAILSTQGGDYDAPHVPPGASAMLIEAPDRGRYIAEVTLRLGAGPDAPLQLLPDAQRWRERLTLQQQARQLGTPEIRAALSAVEADFASIGAGRNLAHLDTLPLSEAYDGPTSAGAVVEAFKDALVASAASTAAQPPTPLEPGYASSGGCVNCHTQEFTRWTFTDHAQAAWLSLVARDAVDDPECIACHSTGFGEPGGFGELTGGNLRKYKAVQCEACHGPMRGHPEADSVHARPITVETCVGCHDAANSPDFDFEAYLPRASCQAP
ncbi:MAG: hypothetical protein ACI8S6_002502 [Myxococcota bacterium]|jgi:hypothetical protein